MDGKWKLGDTVYKAPTWDELTSWKGCDSHNDYETLKEEHEAKLLERSCGLVAVPVRVNDTEKRTETSVWRGTWFATFEDAVEAVVVKIMQRVVSDRQRALVLLTMVEHNRKRDADSATESVGP